MWDAKVGPLCPDSAVEMRKVSTQPEYGRSLNTDRIIAGFKEGPFLRLLS
jgi:hypothetical protein